MDTRKWKEFRVGDVFECKTTKTMLEPEQGDYLYITRTSENNGITDLIKLEDGSFLNNGNCITIGAEGLYAFYQNKDFIAGVKIYALRNEKMNKYSALFVCTMLNQVIYQYSYGRARILKKIKDEMVFLPTTTDGQIDWQFMEDYIKKIYNKVIEEVKASAPALLSLSLSLKNRPVLKCEEWKEFRVGDVFECKTTKTMLEPEDGNYLYITRTSENNGITSLIKLENDDYLNDKNCITIGAEGLYAFYQNQDFIAGVKIYTIKNEYLNKYIALFICTILNQQIYKYSYGRARILEKIIDEKINLPATPQGEPDWEWMEKYVRRIFG